MGSAQSSMCNPPNQTQSYLLRFPNELLLEIAENLDSEQDIYALILTSRRLAGLLDPLLNQFVLRERDGIPALHWAVKNGYKSLVNRILSLDVDINCENPCMDPNTPTTALHHAVWSERDDMVALLLANGAREDIYSCASGRTALHEAVFQVAINRSELWFCVKPRRLIEMRRKASRMETIVRLMLVHGHGASLEHRCDPNIHCPNPLYRDEPGRTPLHTAAQYTRGDTRLLKLLLDHGAAVNDRATGYGSTPLHLAAGWGSVKGTTMLLEYGADVAAETTHGDTPLHHCVAGWYSTSMMQLLIQHGADITKRNNNNMTPFELFYAENPTYLTPSWTLNKINALLST